MTPLRQRMSDDMQVRNLAPHTQRSYLQQVSQFARHFGKSPDLLGPDDIRAYQLHVARDRRLSASSILVAVAAIRFLYKVTLRRDWDLDEVIPSCRKPQKLPVVMSPEEVSRFLEAIDKQRAGSKRLTCRYRWFAQAPLRDGRDAMLVNWVGVTITDARGKATYDGAFVTSLPVTQGTVAEIVACARARWKVENEGFNVLKSNGYHLEHNFGHGKQNLAMAFAAMNLLAFAIHTVCDCLEHAWIDARTAKRARKRFFEHVRTITAYLVFPDWQTLMQTLIDSKPPPDIAAQIAM